MVWCNPRSSNGSFETFIARIAGDSRKMRKTCAKALSGPPSHLSPKLCESCARTTCAQFLRKKGAHAQFLHNFSEPPATQAGSVLRTISAQFSQPGAIFLKSAAAVDRDVSMVVDK